MTTLVRAAALTHFGTVAAACGLEARALVASAGLPPRCLDDPDLKVPTRAVGRLLGTALAEFLVARATGARVHERGFDGRLFEGADGAALDFSLHQSMDHTHGHAYTRSASTVAVGNAPLLNWLWEEARKEWK